MNALTLVSKAATEAWGVDWERFREASRADPTCFRQQLCIATLREDFGMSREQACEFFGRSVNSYNDIRKSLVKKLEQECFRRQARRFLMRLG